MDAYQQRLSAFKDVSGSGVVTAAQDLSTPRTLVALRANETIYVQKVIAVISTDAAQAQSFRDSAGTPLVVMPIKASPGLVIVQADFGPDGFALTEGKSFLLSNAAAGLAYSYSYTAYQKLTAVTVGNRVNSSGRIN